MCFLGERDVPAKDRSNQRIAQLVNTAVLIGHDGVILTVYRNKNALKEHRRKSKYNRHKSVA